MSGLGSRPDVGKVNRGRSPFTKEFIDSPQGIVFSSAQGRPHGFGVAPKIIQLTIINTTAELGYSIGDEIMLNASYVHGGLSGGGFTIERDETNCTVHWANQVFVVRKDTHLAANFIVAANWDFIFAAWV